MSTTKQERWRLIYNPEGDVFDVPSYGASVAEGRIAGKYQLSNTLVPDTVVLQSVKRPGIVAGADVTVDRSQADRYGVTVARLPRSGRNGAKSVGTIQLSDLMAKSSKKFESKPTEPDDPAVLIYTSGTTGLPKGAMLTHRNFHFQCSTVVKSLLDFKPTDRIIGTLPLYHIFGLANSMISAVHYGACLVMIPRYSPQILLETIDRNKATILPAVPTMYQHLMLAARMSRNKNIIPKSLNHCISGGAPLSHALYDQFGKAFETDIMEGYGLTESTSAVAANGVNGKYRDGSIGRAGAGVEMKIINDDGQPVPTGTEGEIAIKSTTIFAGYWNNPEATAKVLTEDGWLLTGDLGYVDEDGFFFITDRKKDIIIRNGYNISPREVEEELDLNEAVLESAVISRKNDKGDETVVAFVVPREIPPEFGDDPAEIDPRELQESDWGKKLVRSLREYADTTLALYKQPQEWMLTPSLPKTATGKVLRRELRQNVEDARLISRRKEHVQN
jgi:long-chain acyl-CoA synthetase